MAATGVDRLVGHLRIRSAEATAQRGTAPDAPRTPHASADGPGITVKWAAPVSNGGSAIAGHRVYRATASGAETLLVNVGPTATSYLDRSVGHKTRYFYWVTALNVLGESVPSGEVTATSR